MSLMDKPASAADGLTNSISNILLIRKYSHVLRQMKDAVFKEKLQGITTSEFICHKIDPLVKGWRIDKKGIACWRYHPCDYIYAMVDLCKQDTWSNRGLVVGMSDDTQAIFCPIQAPLAIMAMPKCGSSSITQWVLEIDGLLPFHRALAGYTCGLFPNVSSGLAAAPQWRGLAKQWAVAWEDWGHSAAIGDKNFLRIHNAFGPTCCSRPMHHLNVIVVRNPFARVVSLYRQSLKFPIDGKPIKHIEFHQNEFEDFYLSGRYRMYNESMGLSDFMRKTRMELMVRIRIETIHSDIAWLENKMCDEWYYCNGLPPPPRLNKHYSKLDCSLVESLWTPKMIAFMHHVYFQDFVKLGYSFTPRLPNCDAVDAFPRCPPTDPLVPSWQGVPVQDIWWC